MRTGVVIAVAVMLVAGGCAGAIPSATAPTPPPTATPSPSRAPTPTPQPTPTPTPGVALPVYLDVGQEDLVSDLPEKGDAWRFELVSVKFGKDALPEGIDPPKLADDTELVAVRVQFTYVGTRPTASVPRADFKVIGSMKDSSGVWGAEAYVFNLVGSFPNKDWSPISRDELHGYTLLFVLPKGMPYGAVVWTPGGVYTIFWNFSHE